MLTAYAANAAEKVTNQTSDKVTLLVELIVEKIPLWIAALIVIVLSVIVAKIVRRMVENKMAEKGIEDEHKEIQILGGRLSYSVILTIGFTIGLKIAGIDLTTIIAAVAFGVGFALKDIITNFLAGIMILLSKNFAIGDFIVVEGTVGRIIEIQSRVTVLQAVDGTKVVVPNAQLFNKQVTSFTSNPFRRIEVETSVDYRSDLKNALKVCMLTVKKTKGILADPKPAILVSEFGDSEIIIKVRAWVESRGGWMKIKSRLLSNLKDAYEKYNIDFPWPMTQLVYDKDGKHGPDVDVKVKAKSVEAKVSEAVAATGAAEAQAAGAPAVAATTGTIELKPNPALLAIDLDDGQQLKPLAEQRPPLA